MNFDLIIPFEEETKKEEIKEELTKLFEESFKDIKAEINIEHSYI